MSTYRETYPDSLSNGHGLIFDLGTLPGVPWATLADEVKQDIERAYNIRSGFKTLIDAFTIPEPLYRAKLLAAMYSEKWTRLWNIYNMEYDPLHAYVVNENGTRTIDNTKQETDKFGRTVSHSSTDSGTVRDSETVDATNNGTESTKYGKTQTEQTTDTGTTTQDTTGSNLNKEGIYGFNSAESSPSNDGSTTSESAERSTRDLAGSRNTTDGGTDSKTITDTEAIEREKTETRDLTKSSNETHGGQDEITGTENNEESWEINKAGNIGYSTPQKLIREEFELWRTPFFAIVFGDIDSFATISVY